jgi:uncharacterized protein (DUF1778 family)
MIDAAVRAARVTFRDHEQAQVTDEIRERFYAILNGTAEPSASLVALAAAPVPAGYELVK